MYREPQRRPRGELEADLAAVSSDLVATALIDAAFFEDVEWAFEHLLRASGDHRPEIVRVALLGFGALVRRGELPTDRRVWEVLIRALEDPDLAGTAEDTIDDIEMYGTLGRRVRQRGVEPGG